MKVSLGITGDRQDDVQYSVAVVPLGWTRRGLKIQLQLVVVSRQGHRRVRRNMGVLAMQAKTRKKTKISETASV
jgi:hypothetical protein